MKGCTVFMIFGVLFDPNHLSHIVFFDVSRSPIARILLWRSETGLAQADIASFPDFIFL